MVNLFVVGLDVSFWQGKLALEVASTTKDTKKDVANNMVKDKCLVELKRSGKNMYKSINVEDVIRIPIVSSGFSLIPVLPIVGISTVSNAQIM